MIHAINAVAVAVAAALVAIVMDNTASLKDSIEFVLTLFLSITLFICVLLSKLWPVGLKDIYLIYFGHPGSILNLAHKSMIGKVCAPPINVCSPSFFLLGGLSILV